MTLWILPFFKIVTQPVDPESSVFIKFWIPAAVYTGLRAGPV
jgi:hypothetical protein